MNFTYHFNALPKDLELLNHLNQAAGKASTAIAGIDTANVPISAYNKRYFAKHQRKLRASLQKYSYLLALAFAGRERPLAAATFVDYGGGSGVMSLLAKAAGVGTVIYNDIYDVSCRDAQILGQEAGLEADYYVQGDVDALTAFLEAEGLAVDAIASYDVIEHVYDIESFFKTLASWPFSPFSIVMASGANPHNPLIRYLLTRHHKKAEYEDREAAWGHKERDTLRAYLAIRRQIVGDAAPGLATTEMDKLARATRGLTEEGIRAQVAAYERTGAIGYHPPHPTNTCDPYTGNWAERLLNTGALVDLLQAEGLVAEVRNGYYGNASNWLQYSMALILNPLISRLGKRGLLLAPYYVIYATRQK